VASSRGQVLKKSKNVNCAQRKVGGSLKQRSALRSSLLTMYKCEPARLRGSSGGEASLERRSRGRRTLQKFGNSSTLPNRNFFKGLEHSLEENRRGGVGKGGGRKVQQRKKSKGRGGKPCGLKSHWLMSPRVPFDGRGRNKWGKSKGGGEREKGVWPNLRSKPPKIKAKGGRGEVSWVGRPPEGRKNRGRWKRRVKQRKKGADYSCNPLQSINLFGQEVKKVEFPVAQVKRWGVGEKAKTELKGLALTSQASFPRIRRHGEEGRPRGLPFRRESERWGAPRAWQKGKTEVSAARSRAPRTLL